MARRDRSADIWRVMASSTAGGGFISRTSTLATFTPQRSVTSSRRMRKALFMSSRLDRTSSRLMSPTTERKVVEAMLMAAPLKSWTDKTEVNGSRTL